MPRHLVLLLVALCCTAPRPGSAVEGGVEEQQAMLESYRRLDELLRLVHREHVESVSLDRLWTGAFRGVVTELDPYSRYLSPAEALLRQEGTVAYGFDWELASDGGLIVRRVARKGPACAAGMVPGDRILSLAGTDLHRVTPTAIRKLLDGAGEQLVLAVLHADGQRQELLLHSARLDDDGLAEVRWIDRPSGIACIAIDRLVTGAAKSASPTLAAFDAAIAQLREDGLRALILDLRGNGGGTIDAAVGIADRLIEATPDGSLLVEQVSRHPSHRLRHLATSAGTLPPWPIACLVDANTASSAEILAAALRDHDRAVIIGARTAGKVTVQRDFRLADGGVLQLTVARWRTLLDHDFSEGGLVPDVVVEETPLQRLQRYRARLAEDAGEPATDEAMLQARNALLAVLIHRRRLGLP